MQLVSFSVQNYRSITKANRIEVGRSTVLVGPNNEGKSNVLRALVTAMQVLKSGSRNINVKGVRVFLPLHLRGPAWGYRWEEDFPIHLQIQKPDGASTFSLEFELDQEEIDDFRRQVNSNLNGTLPIKLQLSRSGVTFSVPKKGPGGKKLSQKAGPISNFVAQKIEFEYIQAIRTAQSVEHVVRSLVAKELLRVEELPGYRDAITTIKNLQQPVLDALSTSVQATMVSFLPAIKNVRFEITEEQRFQALRRSATIIVDDGTPTDLEHKGDGVQSLAAIALMRHASEAGGKGKSFVIAIEEPESHLHPRAIHLLRKIISELAEKYQVVITTHSPLFVDRAHVSSNILVNKNKAVPAKSIDQIRTILGVRTSDNLRHAELVLVVDGEEDKIALRALLIHRSQLIAEALQSGKLVFETLAGGTNLSYVLALLRDALLCSYHCFLDNDECGRSSYEKARAEGFVDISDVNLASVLGMDDSELEDWYDVTFYKDLVWNRYKVMLEGNAKFKGNKKKWSERMKDVFKASGKPWDDSVKSKIKADIANLVSMNPQSAIHEQKRAVIDGLVATLVDKLQTLPQT